MKIEIAKIDLEVALEVAGIAVSTSTELSAHYLFRMRNGKVEVLSHGVNVFAGAPLVTRSEGNDGEAFTVEAWRLNKWLSGVPDGVVKFSNELADVHISAGRSKTRLRSLDPAKYPYWDELLKKATVVGSMPPAPLSKALGLSRWFVSKDDTSKPELCQMEALKGTLWATDRRGMSSIKLPSLPTLNIRIPGKDVGHALKFLGLKQTLEQDVEIKAAEREKADGGGGCTFFLRPDGCYVGVSRPTTAFPSLGVDPTLPNDATLKINRREFDNAIAILSASAPKANELVTFIFDKAAGTVTLSMPCEAGGTDEFALTQVEIGNPDKFAPSFTVDYPYIKGIVNAFSLEDLEFGVNPRGPGGYICFKHVDEEPVGLGNEYYSVIVWRT